MLVSLVVATGCPSIDAESPTEAPGTSAVEEPGPVTTGTAPPSDTSGDAPTTTTTTGVPPSGDPTTSGGSTSTSGAPEQATSITTGSGGSSTGATTGDDDSVEGWTPKGCPDIYAQDILPTFELEVTSEVLAGLKAEWKAADDEDLTDFPLKSFTYGDITITNASIRLRGNADHWPTQGKMQFEIQFNTFDKKGRFMGLRHVLFDAAEYNRSFLRDRLALSVLRDAGVPAPCANNARVVLNGEYYGLFTSIEKVDKEFLERHFEDPDGNLYKRGGGGSLGWSKKTNEKDGDLSDIKKLNAANSLSDLLKVLNLEQALLEWAAEAVIPDRDGLWAGGLNGYTYHDPKTDRFFMIPWDLDDSFTRLEPDVDPITYKKPPETFHGRKFYDIALANPTWRKKYVASVEHVLKTAYDQHVLQQRIDAWAAQIAKAAADDPNRPFTLGEHLDQVKAKRKFVAQRAEFLEDWLE